MSKENMKWLAWTVLIIGIFVLADEFSRWY